MPPSAADSLVRTGRDRRRTSPDIITVSLDSQAQAHRTSSLDSRTDSSLPNRRSSSKRQVMYSHIGGRNAIVVSAAIILSAACYNEGQIWRCILLPDKSFEELYKTACCYIDSHREEAFSLSDDIAAHPELSGEEVRSTDLVCAWLEREGFEVERNYCNMKTAFKAKIGGGHPRVAILVELDALPVVGHGCGHNLSGTMSTFAGAALAKALAGINGELDVIGTPAEETWGAKCTMARLGVMDDVDLAMMIHCYSEKSLISMTAPALQGFNIVYRGVAAHAAGAPWDGRNAFNGARLFFDALDMMRQHVKPDVRMHGYITEAGTAVNTVPDLAKIHIELRSLDKRELESIIGRVRKIAEGTAVATETEVTFEKNDTSFDNPLELSSLEKIVGDAFNDAGLPVAPKEAQGGATDVGNISWRCPAIQPMLSIIDKPVPLHTAELESATRSPLGHERMALGARIMAYTLLRFMTDEKLRREVRAEFEKKSR